MSRSLARRVGCAALRKTGTILHEIVTAIVGMQMAVAGKTFADVPKDWIKRRMTLRNSLCAVAFKSSASTLQIACLDVYQIRRRTT